MFCSQCGREMSEGQQFCPACGARSGAESTMRTATPWEDRANRGAFRGLIETLRASLFQPSSFFRSMPVTGGLTDPLLYGMITGMFGIIMASLWQTIDGIPAFVPGDGRGAAAAFSPSGLEMAVTGLFAPFGIVVYLFLWAGMLHLLLMLVRGAANGFEATFRAAAYGYGTSVFLAVPVCGWPIAVVGNLVVVIIGLREGHGTSGGKASFAVLFPFLLCCAALTLFTMLFIGTLAASFGTLPHQFWK